VAKNSPGSEIITGQGNIYQKIAKLTKRLSIKHIGFESAHIKVRQAEILGSLIAGKLIPVVDIIENLRIIKYPTR